MTEPKRCNGNPCEDCREPYDVCSCSCHTPPLGQWEIEFHKRFDANRYKSVPKDMDVEVEKLKDFIRETITQALAEQKARMVEEIKHELERLRQVRILIPKNVGGNSKCITEGYHRCLDKVEKFIKALSK